VQARPVWSPASAPVPHLREDHFAYLEQDKPGDPQMWGQDAIRGSQYAPNFGRVDTALAPEQEGCVRESEPRSGLSKTV
jgi:hypothetical protein